MDSELAAFAHADPVGETAMHPITRLARPTTLLHRTLFIFFQVKIHQTNDREQVIPPGSVKLK